MYKRQTSLGVHIASSGKCWSAFWCVKCLFRLSGVGTPSVQGVAQQRCKKFCNALHDPLWLRDS